VKIKSKMSNLDLTPSLLQLGYTLTGLLFMYVLYPHNVFQVMLCTQLIRISLHCRDGNFIPIRPDSLRLAWIFLNRRVYGGGYK
jgi:hypothetical protein